jgi:hypothetical protein
LEPIAEILLQRQVRIYADPSQLEKAPIHTEGLDEPCLFDPVLFQTKIIKTPRRHPSNDRFEFTVRKLILSRAEDGCFSISGLDKNSAKLLPLDSSRRCYPPLHENDIRRINTHVIAKIEPEGRAQILEYWELLGKQDILELNLIILLKRMKLLHPLPPYVRGLPQGVKAMAFFLYLFRYFYSRKDVKFDSLPSDPARTAICLRLPPGMDFNLLRVVHRSSEFETETILRMLADPGRTSAVFAALAGHDIFSTYHFVKFAHALYPRFLSGIPFRNPTQASEIRYIRGSLLRFRRSLKPDLSPAKYILAKFFNADIRPGFDFEDEDLELLLEGLLPELDYPHDIEFPLRHRLKVPRWIGEIVPLNSVSRIDEEGDFQQNCLRSIERYKSGSYYGHLSLFSIRKKGLRITVEVGSGGNIIQCFGYKNSYFDPEELDLRTEPDPDFKAPDPVYVNDLQDNHSLSHTAAGLRNRNEFLDTCSALMRKDPAEVREFVDTCMQYLFRLQEEKFKSFNRLRKSVSSRHTLEVRMDFLKVRLTRSPQKTIDEIFGRGDRTVAPTND